VNEPPAIRAAIGMCMVARGEVGLVFSNLGLSANMIDEETYAILVIVIAYTTLFAPFWIKYYYRMFRHKIAEHDALDGKKSESKSDQKS
jgi:Kef-type K+ transport system membrane component KefB